MAAPSAPPDAGAEDVQRGNLSHGETAADQPCHATNRRQEINIVVHGAPSFPSRLGSLELPAVVLKAALMLDITLQLLHPVRVVGAGLCDGRRVGVGRRQW